MDDSLRTFPYVRVRVACKTCVRKRAYRLASLAARFGADIPLSALLDELVWDCEARNPRHPYRKQCTAYFVDLRPPQPPPDDPNAKTLKVIRGGRG
jgi:hypothetical protein